MDKKAVNAATADRYSKRVPVGVPLASIVLSESAMLRKIVELVLNTEAAEGFWAIARKYKISMFKLEKVNGKTILSTIYAVKN